MRTYSYAFGCFLLLTTGPCNSQASELDFLVPTGATDVKKFTAKDRNRTQISYSITLPYPAQAIGQKQHRALLNSGWSRCSGSPESWIAFPDDSTDERRLVHQYIESWVKDNKLLTVVLRYESHLKEQDIPTKLSTPDNAVQRVTVLLDKHEHIDEVKRRLGLSCDT